MKKLLALLLALAMMLTMVSVAFASEEGTGDDTPTGDTPATESSSLPKADVSITNLEENDHVDLYKIVEWDSTESKWNLLLTGMPEAYDTVEKIVTALGNGNANACAAAIAAHLPATAVNADVVGSTGTYTYNAEVGMYFAAVTSGSGTIMYNPMVLSVNYDYSTNPAGATDGTLNAATAALGTTTIAKKQDITLDKVVNGDDPKCDVAVGDIIPFKVTTSTPNYGANYTNPAFILTDELSTGLELTEAQQAAITVTNGASTALTKKAEGVTEYDYEIETTASGYTITFSETYLKAVKANTGIIVEYNATVNALTNMHQVEEYVNTVTCEFSNNPTGNHSSLTDETHHYTFSIDALATGQNAGGDITKELKKIGVDALTGEVITEWSTVEANSWTSRDALSGATFELRKGGVKIKDATSGEDGRLTFEGLDAGEYTLVETGAPAGYKFNTTPIPVKIEATYAEGTDILESYTITINDAIATTYEVTLDGDSKAIETTVIDNSSKTAGIINEKGVTLPSTGGIGTTIFYAVGGLMVLGAAIILVSRRKAEAR